MSGVTPIHVSPDDEFNRRLVANVHPPDWVNPTPVERYNLVVLGAGTAGLIAAVGAAGLGAKVALIERELMGGDCLNVGCVPSKAMIRCSRAIFDAKQASLENTNSCLDHHLDHIRDKLPGFSRRIPGGSFTLLVGWDGFALTPANRADARQDL